MVRLRWWIGLSIWLLLGVSACGGGDADGQIADRAIIDMTQGDAARGEQLFNRPVIGTENASGCRNCHALEPDATLVGPSLVGLGERAAEMVAGVSAETYLLQSIVEPDAYIVPGFDTEAMYAGYGDELSPQEIADLIAYLLTQ